MKKIAFFIDFDLTLSEEYQQLPLIKSKLEKYKNYYKKNLDNFKYLDKDFVFNNEFDFFTVLQKERNYILEKNPNSRIQNGITWLHKLISDTNKGCPLENVSLKDIYESGKKIKLSNNVIECFCKLKEMWIKKNIDLKIYIVSVGLKTLIKASIDSYIEGKNLKNPFDGIYAAEIIETNEPNMKYKIISVIEDYSKTEIAYEIAKGGKEKRDIKLNNFEYIIPHNKFIVIGDGLSDIPMFRFFRKRGGSCIMVYKKGCKKSFQKIMFDAFKNVDYILERDYTPCINNPTWIYLNECIKNISNKKCKHSSTSIHNYKWSKDMSLNEEEEIKKHFANCKEHNYANKLIYVIPRNKIN